MTNRNICYRAGIKSSLLLITVALVVYFTCDYFGPCEIYLKSDQAFGLPCQKAKELVVQQYDTKGSLWATRGMIIYELKKNDNKFIKIAHVPTGFSVWWLRNFSLIRKLTIRPECIEIIPFKDGQICAMSAGHIWHRSSEGKRFNKTMKLPYYGLGNQGIRNDGIVLVNDSTVFFGEYFSNSKQVEVKIYLTRNNGRSWKIAREFQSGQIRHIHALQRDPYNEKLWLCTGDKDEESMVAWSSDEYQTITPVGFGSQVWRVCQLVFTNDAIYWGTDTGSEDLAGIYKWDKDSMVLSKLQKIDGAIFFATRLAKGTIIMSTDRQGSSNEKDDKTHIYIIDKDEKVKHITGGTWHHKKPEFLFTFATLRFQRNQGSNSLAITCLNQKEFNSGDLVIIAEDSIMKATQSN